jgi:hypothetical protein
MQLYKLVNEVARPGGVGAAVDQKICVTEGDVGGVFL